MTSARWYVLAAMVVGGAMSNAQTPRESQITRTFALRALAPAEAAVLVGPYVSDVGSVFQAGKGVQAITVRAPARVLATLDSLLKEYDRPPTLATLRFQLVSASDTGVADASLKEIEAGLRKLAPAGMLRVLAGGSITTTASNVFQLVLASKGGARYTISGEVTRVQINGSSSEIALRITLRQNEAILFATELRSPVGTTIILGSTAPYNESSRAILTFRSEVIAP